MYTIYNILYRLIWYTVRGNSNGICNTSSQYDISPITHLLSLLSLYIQVRFLQYLWALNDSARFCQNALNKDSVSSAKKLARSYLFLLWLWAPVPSSSVQPCQWQSGLVALMKAVINSLTPSLSYSPRNSFCLASAVHSSPLQLLYACPAAGVCLSAQLCVCTRGWGTWTISCDYHLFHPLIFKSPPDPFIPTKW